MGLLLNSPLSGLNIFKIFKDDLPRVTTDKEHAVGSVRFTAEDMHQLYANPNAANRKAYAKMVEAMAVSVNMNSNDANPLDIYPKSAEDAKRMDGLLDEAEKAVQDPEESVYKKMITELRGIVGWCSRRHYNCSQAVLIGSFITMMALLWIFFDNLGGYKSVREDRACIKQWTDAPDFEPEGKNAYNRKYCTPDEYRDISIDYYTGKIDKTQKRLDATKKSLEEAVSFKKKRECKEYIKEYEEMLEKDRKMLDDLKSANFKQLRKLALKDVKVYARRKVKWYWISLIAFLATVVLVPAYIYATHAWGYNIARYRDEDKVLNEIRHASYKFALFMLGSAMATKFVPDKEIITRWSDGSYTHQYDFDTRNQMAMIKMFIFILIGIIVVGITSTFIMLYCTITGLHRNHGWWPDSKLL